MSDVIARFDYVRGRVAASARRSGRDAREVLIVAVSKGVSESKISELYEEGHRDFGENRADELLAKQRILPKDIRWHFIGRLQRNKVAKVLSAASLIHSVERSDLAEALSKRARLAKGGLGVLIEVNVSGETAKGGVAPEQAYDLAVFCDDLEGLRLEGLMTMAPLSGDPEVIRACFRGLRQLALDMQARIPSAAIHHLSMGMSQDYEVAVEEGSTIVRMEVRSSGRGRHRRVRD
ncbi:MAG: YggS family pyridoxal phosphate-dependent enzyme [Actinomycetota bacterium]|nr:YggS family pyridoxal phosphate-dependent enzyme [Actinomycetota bacterium]